MLPDLALQAATAADKRRQLKQILGPFDGIPIAVKDNFKLAHNPTTAGTAYNFNQADYEEANVVNQLQAAGAIIIGKLNMDEGAIGATTRNPFWGQCDNPKHPGMTPGGSSGGSAAAVAAGWVPVAMGSDTLGSARIPAAYCGVWGLKPTKEQISTEGMVPLSPTLDCIGLFANCAEDLGQTLNLLAQRARPVNRTSTVSPIRPASLSHEVSLKAVRFGILNWKSQIECEKPVQAAFDNLLNAARLAGAEITIISIENWQATLARRAGLVIAEAECASWLQPIIERHENAFSSDFKKLIQFGKNVSGEKLKGAYDYVNQLKTAIERSMNSIDYLLTPTVPQRPFVHSSATPINQADFTVLANIGNCPAVAFPMATTKSDFPLSVQVIGKAFCEADVLNIAASLAELDLDSNSDFT